MELTHLIQFKAIADCNTMTEASEKLHVSQPALSTTLRKLEKELGIRLFDRAKNHISLNTAGKIVLNHTNNILEQVEQMKKDLYLHEYRNHIFSIAFCDPGPMWYCVPKFSVSYPEIEVKSRLFEDIEKYEELLLSELYDVVITSNPIDTMEITFIPFVKEQLLLSVPKSNPLSCIEEISLRNELNPITIDALFVGGIYFQTQQKFLNELKDKITLKLCEDYFLFSQKMKKTDIISLSTKLVKHYRDDGENRVLIPITDKELSIDYYVCYLRKNRSKINNFITWVAECHNELQ